MGDLKARENGEAESGGREKREQRLGMKWKGGSRDGGEQKLGGWARRGAEMKGG